MRDMLVILSISNHNYWPLRSLEVKNGGQSAKIDFPQILQKFYKNFASHCHKVNSKGLSGFLLHDFFIELQKTLGTRVEIEIIVQ